MDGGGLYRQAVRLMPEAIAEVLEKSRYSVEDLDVVVAHQANDRILAGVRRQLGVDDPSCPSNIARWGNTTAATFRSCFTNCGQRVAIGPGRSCASPRSGREPTGERLLYRQPDGSVLSGPDQTTMRAVMPRIRAETIEAHKALTRSDIVDAAHEILAEMGSADISLAEVAHAAGIGRTTLYEYFRDKDDLIASLVEERLPVVVDEMIESVSAGCGTSRSGYWRWPRRRSFRDRRPGTGRDPPPRAPTAVRGRPGPNSGGPRRSRPGDDRHLDAGGRGGRFRTHVAGCRGTLHERADHGRRQDPHRLRRSEGGSPK
jgi:AcrR family transcriptional regulator